MPRVRLVLVFGRDDPARVRFAVSPLWETLVALRVLLEPHRRSYHLPWLDLVRPDLDRLDLWPLLVLSPRTGGPRHRHRRSTRAGPCNGARAGSPGSATVADRTVRGARARGGLAAAG